MDDFALAVKCHQLGAAWFDETEGIYWTADKNHILGTGKRVCRDWSVAGALIKLTIGEGYQLRIDETGASADLGEATDGRGLMQECPRDIVEACVEALTSVHEEHK